VKMPLFVSFTNFYGLNAIPSKKNKINTKHVKNSEPWHGFITWS
jgi:hypothetical protein